MTPAMKVLICGSRGWEDEKAILERVRGLPQDTLIISGEAPGADRLAEGAALRLGYHCASVRPLWTHYGKRAGHLRNSAMLSLEPDLVIAFSLKTPGTANMLQQAQSAGVQTEIHYADGHVELELGGDL